MRFLHFRLWGQKRPIGTRVARSLAMLRASGRGNAPSALESVSIAADGSDRAPVRCRSSAGVPRACKNYKSADRYDVRRASSGDGRVPARESRKIRARRNGVLVEGGDGGAARGL
ncbi:hypothetical protein [Burkholderia perseverans]|uniref:hypothetical protein n=1 Tax=Burkholderia perseverans TaxID=2615214 RepID=UPI001FEE5298|nr:hypothetical protein [Burkholderia perseverans]